MKGRLNPHCGEGDLALLEPEFLLRVRRHQFGCDALVDCRESIRNRHPDWALDRATLEEIMLFYAKGEER